MGKNTIKINYQKKKKGTVTKKWPNELRLSKLCGIPHVTSPTQPSPPAAAVSFQWISILFAFTLVIYRLYDFISCSRHPVPCYTAEKKLGANKWTFPKLNLVAAKVFWLPIKNCPGYFCLTVSGLKMVLYLLCQTNNHSYLLKTVMHLSPVTLALTSFGSMIF